MLQLISSLFQSLKTRLPQPGRPLLKFYIVELRDTTYLEWKWMVQNLREMNWRPELA